MEAQVSPGVARANGGHMLLLPFGVQVERTSTEGVGN